LAARWLKTPEVIRWWGDPEHELTVLTQDLDEPSMRPWIVEYRGRPFAYVQAYPVGAWPRVHLKHLCANAQMIDAFVGEPDMLHQGHGSAFLRELAQMLIDEGSAAIAIDPDAKNERARRAYARLRHSLPVLGSAILKSARPFVGFIIRYHDSVPLCRLKERGRDFSVFTKA
jgi:aminoglycoside 6'-N-acetyltransferase